MQINGADKIFRGGWQTYLVTDTVPTTPDTQYSWSTLGVTTEYARENRDKFTFYLDELNIQDQGKFIIYCNVYTPPTAGEPKGRSYNLSKEITKNPAPVIEVKELKAEFTTSAENGMIPKKTSTLRIDPSKSSTGSGIKYMWMFDTEHKRVHMTKLDKEPFDINVDQLLVDKTRGSQGYLNLYIKLSVGKDDCNPVYQEQRCILVDR